MAPLIVEDEGGSVAGYHTFGAGAADVTTDAAGNAVGGIQMTIWDAEVGGTQVTDLLDADGTPLPGYITSSSDSADIGRLRFQAPASYSVVYGDRGYGDRFVFTAREALANLGTAITKADQASTDAAQAVAESSTALQAATAADARSVAAQQTADSAYAIATSATVRDLLAELPTPFYLAHRGDTLAPENSLEAFRSAVNAGAVAVELDLRATVDDQLVVMHDATVDRTTNGAGTVANMLAAQVTGLNIDASGPWAGRVCHPPTAQQVLEEFGDRVFLSLECKDDRSAQLLPAVLDKYLKVKTNVICVGTTIARMQPLLDAGYPVAVQDDTTLGGAPLAAAGVVQANAGYGYWTQALIDDMHANGIRCQTSNIARQYQALSQIALGIDSMMVDNEPYVAGRIRRTTDPWAAQSPYPGDLSGGVANGGSLQVYTAPDQTGFNNGAVGAECDSGALLGWASPVKGDPSADTYTIDFTLRINAAWSGASNCGIAIRDTDHPWSGATAATPGWTGYLAKIENGGELEIRWYPGDGTYSVLASAGVAGDLPLNTPHAYRLTVTPASIKLADLTKGTSCTTTDTTMRGGYLHLSSAGCTCRFYDMTIS